MMSLYISRGLSEIESHVKSLGRLVQEKGNECCVCGDKNVSVWLFDGGFLGARSGLLMLFARLLCEAHDKKWKENEMLPYEKLNGVMFIEMPYQKPVGMWANISWSDFLELIEAYSKDNENEVKISLEEISSFEEYLMKNAQFVYKGKVERFLKNE